MAFTYSPEAPTTFRATGIHDNSTGIFNNKDNDTGMVSLSTNGSSYASDTSPIFGAQWLIILAVPVIVLLGTLGNLLSMAILLRPRFRKLNVNIYLFSLAIADTVFLWTNSLTRVFIKLSLGVNYSTYSLQACQAYVFILYTSKCLSAWFIVAVTIERLLVVMIPFKMKRSSSRKRAVIVGVVLTVLACAVFAFVPTLYTVSWDEQDQENRCQITEFYLEKKADLYLKLGDLFLYSLLPTIALVTSNAAMVYRLISSVRFRKANTENNSKKVTKQDQGARRLTITLILVSACFLICTLPLSAFLLHSTLYPSVGSYGTIYLSLYTLEVLNSSVNFLLYCVSGPTFRAELRLGWRRMCKAVCCRRDTDTVDKGDKAGVRPGQSPSSLRAFSNVTAMSATPTTSTDDLVTNM